MGNLEAELSQSLGEGFSGKSSKSVEQEESNSNDEFFASLQQEMGKTLGDSPESSTALEDDFFSSLPDDLNDDLADELEKKSEPVLKDDTSAATNQNDLKDDFFSSLLDDLDDDLADELEKKSEHVLKDDTSAATNQNDLISLTVRELKDLLRTKGLKVGGKKAELIKRLQ